MKEFSEIKAFDDEFELYHLPKVRIIGKETRNGGALGNTAPALWDAAFQSGAYDHLKKLPHVLRDSLFGWTCEYDATTDTFVYIVCAVTPADTPVPEGYSYRDIPETVCAKGLYGETVQQTIERARTAGYVPNWDSYGWNAECYLDAEEQQPPKQTDMPWHWIVPVKKEL